MRLLTVREASERLQVCRKTVWNWLAAGRLRGVQVGRDWVIEESALADVRRPKRGPPNGPRRKHLEQSEKT